jgi:hypothetical protein
MEIEMGVIDKIKERMDMIKIKMESNQREGIEEIILNVAKYWPLLSENDREYIQAVRYAVDERLPWNVN